MSSPCRSCVQVSFHDLARAPALARAARTELYDRQHSGVIETSGDAIEFGAHAAEVERQHAAWQAVDTDAKNEARVNKVGAHQHCAAQSHLNFELRILHMMDTGITGNSMAGSTRKVYKRLVLSAPRVLCVIYTPPFDASSTSLKAQSRRKIGFYIFATLKLALELGILPSVSAEVRHGCFVPTRRSPMADEATHSSSIAASNVVSCNKRRAAAGAGRPAVPTAGCEPQSSAEGPGRPAGAASVLAYC